MKFIDEVVIEVKAGRGGNGCVAFRREKFRPLGGPSGGNGGRGGDIILVGNEGLSTLIELKYSPKWRARKGEHGKGKDMYGKNAAATKILVPVGTIVKDMDTGEALADIREHGQAFIAARGGKGGRGNLSFKNARCTAPDWAEEGEEGEQKQLVLELHLIADVGLAGFPNVGKSTLIRKVSAAKPKVADYPFTTLTPNLGVVRLDENRSFVVADIPGIIEGAAGGAGLGLRFLRHIERTKVLCHMVTLDAYAGREPEKDYDALNRELGSYSEKLAARTQIVVLNKVDLQDVKGSLGRLKKKFEAKGIELHAVSALTGQGMDALMELMWKELRRAAEAGQEGQEEQEKRLYKEDDVR
ncbi:MAG: GTPase ObgE [Pseudomonadota bacterium]